MQRTNIGWTNFSSNLLKYRDPDGNVVHACVKISTGCSRCYSAAFAPRWGRKGKPYTESNMKPLTPFFDMDEARKVFRSKKITGQKVFIDDMTDWAGEWVSDEIMDYHVALVALRPDVTFQFLTKRADRQKEYLNQHRYHEINLAAREIAGQAHGAVMPTQSDGMVEGGMPLPHMHVGVSAENQDTADKRGFLLQETRAAIRWMSIEPMLEPIFLRLPDPSCNHPSMDGRGPSLWFCNMCDGRVREIKLSQTRTTYVAPIDGIVIGGESGASRREMPIASAIRLAEQAQAAGVSVYVKQDSALRPGTQGRFPTEVWRMKDWPTTP